MQKIQIRAIRQEEYFWLDEFLYQAIFQREGVPLLPREIIREREIEVYIKEFGREHDYGLLAVLGDQPVGAVWVRILNGNIKGFGNIDDRTPEFAISVLPEFRGRGIGTKLMKAMLELLREKGYPRTTLAVQKDNYAVGMYKEVGFYQIGENEQEYVMQCDL